MIFNQVAADDGPLQPATATSPPLRFLTGSPLILVSKHVNHRYTSGLRRQLRFEGVEVRIPMLNFDLSVVRDFLASLNPKERANVSSTGSVIYFHTMTRAFRARNVQLLFEFNADHDITRTCHDFTAPDCGDEDGHLNEAFEKACVHSLKGLSLAYILCFKDSRRTADEYDRFELAFKLFRASDNVGNGDGNDEV